MKRKITKRGGIGLTLMGRILVIALLFLWSIVFVIGVSVNSAPYMDKLSFDGGFILFVKHVFIVIFTYTVTNAAILVFISGQLGVLGQRLSLTGDKEADKKMVDRVNPYMSALARSLVVFGAGLSIWFMLDSSVLDGWTQEKYIMVSVTLSVASLYFNYMPGLLSKLLTGVLGAAASKLGSKK